jgi:hypothetical protein
MTLEAWKEAEANVRETEAILAETGWLRVKGESLVADGVWICGWVQPDTSMEAAADLAAMEERVRVERLAAHRPTVVYDRPDGEVIGFGIGTAGHLPVGADADFDLEAAIIERNGCLALSADECHQDPSG